MTRMMRRTTTRMVEAVTRRCRRRWRARLRHRCPRGRGPAWSTKEASWGGCRTAWTRSCTWTRSTGDGGGDGGGGGGVVGGAGWWWRYGSRANRTGRRRYQRCCPVPPRRSLGAQGSRGRGNQDSTRDPLYCRGWCNRQRRRGDLKQTIFIFFEQLPFPFSSISRVESSRVESSGLLFRGLFLEDRIRFLFSFF